MIVVECNPRQVCRSARHMCMFAIFGIFHVLLPFFWNVVWAGSKNSEGTAVVVWPKAPHAPSWNLNTHENTVNIPPNVTNYRNKT